MTQVFSREKGPDFMAFLIFQVFVKGVVRCPPNPPTISEMHGIVSHRGDAVNKCQIQAKSFFFVMHRFCSTLPPDTGLGA